MRFWSREKPVEVAAPQPEVDTGHGKGRPTPTRKEAEAARRKTLRVPSDPKAARKAARARAAQDRQASRAALLAGDESALPPRDAGPVKKYIRDYVDSRFAAAELFLPLALVVLVLGFIRVPALQSIVSMVWLVTTVAIVVDTTLLLRRLQRQLKQRWPVAAERKGATLYAIMRVLQLRFLRLPPPKVRIGGKPAKPKKKKGA